MLKLKSLKWCPFLSLANSLSVVFFFVLFAVVATAEARVRCGRSYLQPVLLFSGEEFQQQRLLRIQGAKIRSAPVARNILSELSQRLETIGIRSELAVIAGHPGFERERNQVLRITGFHQSLNTTVAGRSLQRVMETLGTEIYIDPYIRLRGIARGFYNSRNGRIVLDISSILNNLNYVIDVLPHEARHAHYDKLSREGREHPFQIDFRSEKEKFKLRFYEEYLSAEELATHELDLHINEQYVLMGRVGFESQIRKDAKGLQSISNFLIRNLSTALENSTTNDRYIRRIDFVIHKGIQGITAQFPILQHGDHGKRTGVIEIPLLNVSQSATLDEALPAAQKKIAELIERAKRSRITARQFLEKYSNSSASDKE